MKDFTIIIPFWNGNETIQKLLDTIPTNIPVIVSKDYGSQEPEYKRDNTITIRLDSRGYFSGACNVAIDYCDTDVLILNQDVWFENDNWIEFIRTNQAVYGVFGDGVFGHPAWNNGYVQGTFMYISRQCWQDTGKFNWQLYPLWGSTCEYQLRACRKNYKALPVSNVPGLQHEDRQRFGSAITQAIKQEPNKQKLFLHTPPIVSVIIPCYNYAKYLEQAVNSLIGGKTDLGDFKPQTMQSFEIIIVDDCSSDDTQTIGQNLADDWKAIKYIRNKRNLGTASALNEGIKRANGQFVHILSADDLRSEYCLANFLEAQMKNQKSFVYGDTTTFADGQVIKRLAMGDYDFESLLHKNNIPAGIMFPKVAWEEVGGYPVDFSDGREDWAFAVALGEFGWCGVYIAEKTGNLYRREKQNRSYINAKEKKKGQGYYLAKMKNKFRHLYNGERPIMCCGRGKSQPKSKPKLPSNSPVSSSKLLETQAGVTLQYIGSNVGTSTWYGTETGTSYKFGLNPRRRLGKVRPEDVDKLVSTGQFKIVSAKKNPVKVQPIKREEPKVLEPVIDIVEESYVEGGIDDSSGELDYAYQDETENQINITSGAKQYADEHSIDTLELQEHFGENYRITKRDVEDYAKELGLV